VSEKERKKDEDKEKKGEYDWRCGVSCVDRKE
jgi:hypothetical protein